MSGPCDQCRAEQDRWRYETSPLTHSRRSRFKIASGAVYDDSAAGARDRMRIAFEEWRDLVNSQCALIAKTCHHPVIVPLPEPEPWGQYDLFGVAS